MVGTYVEKVVYASFVEMLLDSVYLFGVLPVAVKVFEAPCVVEGCGGLDENILHVLVWDLVIAH